jgi:hypothetical protein
MKFGRANKYRAKGLHTPDGYFHSQGEYKRWQELKLAQRVKQISELKRGDRYVLAVKDITVGHYKPDFEYLENGEIVVEDYKGVWTTDAKLRIKLFEAIYGMPVKITGRAKSRRAA